MAQAVTQTTPIKIDQSAGRALLPPAPNREKALQILSKSIYKELRENGYEPKQIVALATEIISLVDDRPRSRTNFLAFPGLFEHSSRAPTGRAFFCPKRSSGRKNESFRHGHQDDFRAGHRRPAPLHPRRLQCPADARREGVGRHPHPREPADHQARDREGRAGRPGVAPRPPQGQARQEVLARAGGGAAGRAARRRRRADRRAGRRRRPQGGQRSASAGAVALLENLRFSPAEEANDEAFSRALASYADVYVNDAFGTAHRAHASTAGITKFVADKGMGLLMEREVKFLGKLLGDVERPFVAIIGGAKVSDKIGVLDNLLGRVDQILIGGAMANTFLKAKGGQLGRSLVEEDKLALARAFLRKAEEAERRRAAAARRGGGRRHQGRVGPRRAGDGGAGGSGGARHRPRDGARLRRRDRARQDHLLERPDGRVRVGAVRGRHAGGRQGGGRRRRARCRSSAAATRWRRSTRAASPTRSPTSRPAAAPRSSSSRGRSSPGSRRSRAESEET